jgi:hypothetical protein
MAKILQKQFDYDSYVKNMRLALASDEVVLKSGGINHEYFLQKKGGYWGSKHDDFLLQGLKTYGVGNWEEIKNNCGLETFYDVELELQTQMLLGDQDLAKWGGKKITDDDVMR